MFEGRVEAARKESKQVRRRHQDDDDDRGHDHEGHHNKPNSSLRIRL